MNLLLAASLFFTTPAPQDLPSASAFLVTEGEVRRLEDRYDVQELWSYRSLVGQWYDDERMFFIHRLDTLPPALTAAPPETREDYVSARVAANPKKRDQLRRLVERCVPYESGEFRRPRQMPRGYEDVFYCHGTNATEIVCAFRPEESPTWYLATWVLAEGDAFGEKLQEFEHEFLDRHAYRELPVFGEAAAKGGSKRPATTERELLREDVRRGVAAYADWHFTDSPEFVIVDDLGSRDFAVSITNAMPLWRKRFAEVLPTPIDGTNVLAVARVYANRDDYIWASGVDMAWSAAYWCPRRRELVACLPVDGDVDRLRRTFHHESFHQHLSYALAMVSASPWLNEGYAEYFEHDESGELDWGGNLTPQRVDELAEMLPVIFDMDYDQFYAGTAEELRLKYLLARSIAVFIEQGAPKVRFQPFKNLKRDYVRSLLANHDMREATASAFGSSDKLAHFVSEWKRFWKNR